MKPKTLISFLVVLLIGIGIGVTTGMSFERTVWEDYKPDFFTYISVLTTVLSVLLAFFSLWQAGKTETQKERTSAQMKIWMQDAKGFVTALNRLVASNPSTIIDLKNSILVVKDIAESLFKSISENRISNVDGYKKIDEFLVNQHLKSLKAEGSSDTVNKIIALPKPTGTEVETETIKSEIGKNTRTEVYRRTSDKSA